jgi:hypothetical protein
MGKKLADDGVEVKAYFIIEALPFCPKGTVRHCRTGQFSIEKETHPC